MVKLDWRKWKDANNWTWDQLNDHLWEEFRLALYEAGTETEAHGVRVEFTQVFNEVRTEMSAQGVRIEFGEVVNRTKAEMIVNIIVSNRDYLGAMLAYLPYFERNTSVFREVLSAYDRQFRRVEQNVNMVGRNIFLDTAIEILGVHERDLNIDNQKLDLAYDQRREQVSSRYRAVFDQTTEETIKAVASAYANGGVEITPGEVPGMFDIRFIGLGIPDNLDGLSKALNVIFPAHLGYEFKFTFSTWDMVSALTWGRAKDKTWNELREWEEVI